ncbi:MAG TPA: efflux RND transporter periplasmic adaptor subunit [Burkholderiales bacterium]|nr:efflux RND transporter periplasmic adaptor subunit [Burkholderiales bacterium]
MRRKNLFAVGVIALIGIALALMILRTGSPKAGGEEREHGGAEAAHEAIAKGPHGGRMLTQGAFALEITIFEQGVPPEFRVYAFDANKPVEPSRVQLDVTLKRLGTAPEPVKFRAEGGYLRSDHPIVEPHSFTVDVGCTYIGQTFRWSYEQVEGRVMMDDATAKGAGIEVRTAGPARIRSTLELSGEIQFNQDRLAHVVPRLAGVVVRSVKNLGDEVKKGDLLAVLESQALADLKSEHLATQKRLDLARTTFDREKRLWEEKISAEQDYLASRQALSEAEIAHRNTEQKLLALGLTHESVMRGGAGSLTRYEVRAPIDGVVIEKHLALGEAVKEDASVLTIADLTTVWAEMTIYPKDLNRVKLGQKVTVHATGLNAQAEGRVAYVGSLVGEQTRSAKARVTLPNPERAWRPGLFVTVELVQGEAEVAVAVPVEAVQSYREWKVVFGRYGEFFEVRPVELGTADGKWVEVVKGLSPGTPYAAANSFVLKADLGKAGASHDH